MFVPTHPHPVLEGQHFVNLNSREQGEGGGQRGMGERKESKGEGQPQAGLPIGSVSAVCRLLFAGHCRAEQPVA